MPGEGRRKLEDRTRVTIYLSRKDALALDKLAQKETRSLSSFVGLVLEEYLKKGGK